MQIGADIYCDSAAIIRKIDELYPEPTIYPDDSEAICHVINLWADSRFFFSTTPVLFEKIAATVGPEFIEDRAKMMKGASLAEIGQSAPDARNQVRAYLDLLDRQLANRDFILGSGFSLADAASFHPVWFLRVEPSAFALAQKHRHLMRWFQRLESMGVGEMTPMTQDEAIAIARKSEPAAGGKFDADDPNGIRAGMKVSVTATDYAFDSVTGAVVSSSLYEIAIERNDADLGRIVNHFPKIGFKISPA
jgi:glutathione S-transferase